MGVVIRGDVARPSADGRPARRASCLAFSIVGALLTWAQPSLAQEPGESARLTVRPHEMVLGTRTERAGEYRLDSVDPQSWVYVPPQCVGIRRCPLVVLSNTDYQRYSYVADKYGMIMARITPGGGDHFPDQVMAMDRGIKEILRTFAIDPDKIVIAGRCATGEGTIAYGDQNPDVFSRVVVFTQHTGQPPVKSPNQMTEYYIAGGLLEDIANFLGVRQLRDRGYTVKHTIQLRGHTDTYEDYDFMGHWLQESWAIPDPAARPVPYAFGDPPLLTAEVLAQMTTFWTRFMQEPDSIKTTARQAHVREVVVPVGNERVSTLMVDMPALAAQYPSVAAALQAAGLTPSQHDAYRAALVSAQIANVRSWGLESAAGAAQSAASAILDSTPREETVLADPTVGIASTSVLAKNAEFMNAHPDEFAALETAGMWSTP